MATIDESQPHCKEHAGKMICFADTLEQARNALMAKNKGKDPTSDMAKADHLMLFGVEKWDEAQSFAAEYGPANYERLEIFGSTLADAQQEALAGLFTPGEFQAKHLDLDNTELNAKGMETVMTNVSQCSSLETINLQGSIKDNAALEKCLGALAKSQCLNKLDLKINELKEEGAGDAIGKFLQEYAPQYKPGQDRTFELDLFYNELKPNGVLPIAKALSASEVLTHLDLCCNNIQDDGAIAIAQALISNRTLKVLKLALNSIGWEGGVSIFKALYNDEGAEVTAEKPDANCNYSLRVLDLSANLMKETAKEVEERRAQEPDMGLRYNLARVIDEGYGLTDLDFTGIEFDDMGWDDLSKNLANIPENGFWLAKRRELFDAGIITDVDPSTLNNMSRIIRFSIVDLMDKDRLARMEEKIWNKGEGVYDHIDWRRKPKKKEEEEKKGDDN